MSKKTISLPPLSEAINLHEHFPTAMQAFIFRNWGSVPVDVIAKCLETDIDNVEKQAYKMGLMPQGDVSEWFQRGYISIIKSNWHLLPYSQLMTLLGFSKERLALVLKEEDFLEFKLGRTKPDCEKITYRELSYEEECKTQKIKKLITETFNEINQKYNQPPFDFLNSFYKRKRQIAENVTVDGKVKIDENWYINDKTSDSDVSFMTQVFEQSVSESWGISIGKIKKYPITLEISKISADSEYHEITIREEAISIVAADSAGIFRALMFLEEIAMSEGGMYFPKKEFKRRARFKTRFIYSFCGLYNDSLDVDSRTYCSDELLLSYARTGINGIWIQAVLYRLCEFEFNPSLSEGWEMRLNNLREFSKRAKKYGIKIYLYINEPRAMPLSFFESHPDILGNKRDDIGCMCTSSEKVQKYLASAIETVCRRVPELGGFFTITRSENVTNCYSLNTQMTCPRCAERKNYEIIAEVNRIISESAKKVSDNIRVFAWDWAWRLDGFMTSDEIKKCISLMPKDVILMSNRETELPTDIGGIKSEVNDYSLSVCGLSLNALEEWEYALSLEHETCAKLQINNSWECSTIPYLPVYSLLTENVEALAQKGVSHLMLSWTLGGYPSPNIKIVSELFFEDIKESKPDYERVYRSIYGEMTETVRRASDIFSRAFKEFPFHIFTLYRGPQNGGASNPLYLKKTGLDATMTCYAYDDLERWRSVYPEEVFENQFKKLCDIWKEGLKMADMLQECEFKDVAYATYIQFKASYNQIRFIRARDRYLTEKNHSDRCIMLEILELEKELACKLYEIMRKNPAIGFEAANHYYYTQANLMEKVINCEYLISCLK